MIIAWILLLDCVLCLDWPRSVIGGMCWGRVYMTTKFLLYLLSTTPLTSHCRSGVFAVDDNSMDITAGLCALLGLA